MSTEKLSIRLDDPEMRATWEAAQRAKAEVASWPPWKRGDDALPSTPMPPVATDTQALALLRALADLLRYPFDDGVPLSVSAHADRLQAAIDAGDAAKSTGSATRRRATWSRSTT